MIDLSAMPSPAPHAASAGLHTRVLVADDNPINQLMTKRMLEKLGCQVDLAGNGTDAVALAQTVQYDLIFMDCSMPIKDGYEATAELRRLENEDRRVPIIALTANDGEEDRLKCMAAGMDDFLTKPIALDALRCALALWMERAAIIA